MKKILLAINGINFRHSPFLYTLQFCHLMMTELFILQVIDPKYFRDLIKNLKNKTRLTQQYLENTMSAAALSESGNQDLVCRFLQEGKANIEQSIPFRFRHEVYFTLQQRIGNVRKEILDFLEAHSDIALAVYDGPQKSDIKKNISNDEAFLQKEIPFRLGIPFIKPSELFLSLDH